MDDTSSTVRGQFFLPLARKLIAQAERTFSLVRERTKAELSPIRLDGTGMTFARLLTPILALLSASGQRVPRRPSWLRYGLGAEELRSLAPDVPDTQLSAPINADATSRSVVDGRLEQERTHESRGWQALIAANRDQRIAQAINSVKRSMT